MTMEIEDVFIIAVCFILGAFLLPEAYSSINANATGDLALVLNIVPMIFVVFLFLIPIALVVKYLD